jgi:hypothetical protein
MQLDWEAFVDGLVSDGTVTDRQAGNWGNPCTPETFKSWQKRNGLVRRPRAWDESKKNESDGSSWALDYLEETAKEKGLKVGWEGPTEMCITIGTTPYTDRIYVTDDAPGEDDTSLELYVPAAHINTSGLTLRDVLDYLDDPIGKRDAVQFKNGNRSNKVESKKSEGNASDYVGKYYVDIEDEDEGTLYSSDMEFVSARKASLWAFDELKKNKDDADVFQASVYQLFINDDGDLDHELIEVIHKSDLDESKKSEATKFGAGMATRKDFSKTKNLGEIFDVLDEHLKSLKAASEDMSKSKEDLEASIKKLQEFEGYTDFLKQQSVKGIKKALTLKNSPEVQAASEIEKNLKDALSVIMSDYKNVTDVTQLMVVIDSKYATRGSQILTTLEGQVSRAIDVDMKTIKDSIESGDITEDDVMKLVTMTSVSKGMKNKDTATKVKPVLERMNAMLESASKVEEAIIDPQQFKELRDLVEQIVNEASTPKETIKTTVTALDKETISSVPEAKDGGLLGKLKEFVKDIKDKIAGLWDSFTSLFFSIEDDALEASDVFDEVEAQLGEEGISIDAGKKTTETLSKQFEVLTKSVLTCCDNLVKDSALAGEFDDEVIYAEEAVKNAVESFQNLGEACKSLKDSLSCHKNEDNMNVIGILADAITQIVADEEGVIEDEETADAEDDSNSVIDDVERRYSAPGGEQEEPEMGNEGPEMGNEGPELGGEEPEEF